MVLSIPQKCRLQTRQATRPCNPEMAPLQHRNISIIPPLLPSRVLYIPNLPPIGIPLPWQTSKTSGWHKHRDTMAPTYYSASRSTRDHFIEPPSILARIFSSDLSLQIRRLWERKEYNMVSTKHSRIPRSVRRWQFNPRSWANLPHLLVGVWMVMLLWGERWVFQSAVEECKWENWERWVRRIIPWKGRPVELLADGEMYSPKMRRPII